MEGKLFQTTLYLSGEDFNLKALLDLLSRNNIKISLLGATNKKVGAEQEVTSENIPVGYATLTLQSPEAKVREVLMNSEFKDKIQQLFGHDLNQ